MIQAETEQLILRLDDHGLNVSLLDKRHNQWWLLDDATRLVAADVPRFANAPTASDSPWERAAVERAGSRVATVAAGRVEHSGENAVRTVHDTSVGQLVMHWILERDRLRIRVDPTECSGPTAFTLPGTFRPEPNGFASAVPNCQGILHSGRGPAFYSPKWGQGSMGVSLAFFGQVAGSGGLAVVAETEIDTTLHWEKTGRGDIRLMWRQEPCRGGISYPREAVLMPSAPDLTALCKTYRRYEIEKGRFRSWQDKIAERPMLSYLPGACIVFIGYWDDPDCDYEAGFRQLRRAGIDKALVYPVFHGTTQDTSNAIEGDWIDRRELIPILKEIGYLPGGFLYITDGSGHADARESLRLDVDGNPQLYWEMSGLRWYNLAFEARDHWARHFLAGPVRDMDWLHWDVLTCPPFAEDYSPAHPGDGRADAVWRRRALAHSADKGMIVSSEGFWGRAVSDYDLANTKLPLPVGGDEYAVVPMTMLVYHDSAYHTWWEVDNYNNPEHRSQYNRGYASRYPFGGGWPRLQSAMDALMGCPPDIFPFGRQWNLVPHRRDLYFYNRRFDDPLLADAITAAKRVMALNSRTGLLEMTRHVLHTPDGALQETQFADGTRVIVNFANVPLEAPGAGLLAAASWVSVEAT